MKNNSENAHSFKTLSYDGSSNEVDYLLIDENTKMPLFISLEYGVDFHYRDKEQVRKQAEHICKAVNNYDSLVDALEHLIKSVQPHIYKLGVKKGYHELVALEAAKTALDKVGVKTFRHQETPENASS